jgi:acetyltransferase-like isoleucine patch superfamily enzyme
MHLLNKLLLKITLFNSNDLKKYKAYKRYLGVGFGKNVRITGLIRFGSEPYLISIGNNVTLTDGVVFHTHDGAVGILRDKYPGINIFKPIKVGNNVFIGSNSTILPGITIGNNVAIGASSLVTKDIPDNCIAAGVPAKIIKTLAEFEEKVLDNAVYISETNPRLRKIQIQKSIETKRN